MTHSVTLLKAWFDYDPVHGRLIRVIKARSDAFDVISPERNTVNFDGVNYDYATLCWILYHGKYPDEGHIIDHKNRIRADHRIDNLRQATRTQNQQNKAGYGMYSKGVTWRNRKLRPWQAKIRVNGERIHLGSFETEEEAAQAYRDTALKYHGEFACLV
jgi:hypothetical protein